MKRRHFLCSASTFVVSGCMTKWATGEEYSDSAIKETIYGVPILNRSEWNAEGAKLSHLKPLLRKDTEILYLTIHHTAGAISYKKTKDKKIAAEKRIKNDQFGHIHDKGWGDIAYHYMVTPQGLVYETRDPIYASDSGSQYYTKEQWESAGQDATGKSLYTYPSGQKPKSPGASASHLNLAFVGDYTKDKPTEAAYKSMVKLAAAMLKKYNIETEHVFFHREVANTTCPGNQIYEYFRGGAMKRNQIGTGLKRIQELRKKLG